MRKLNLVGKKYITNQGYEIEIIEYFNWHNCTIRFKSGLVLYDVDFTNIKSGKTKNPLHPAVLGIGFIGIGKYSSRVGGKMTKAYQQWSGMLQRCYCEKQHLKTPTYTGCSVDERWHNFQNFAAWHEENYREGFSLDKDILLKGNKVYSPETCDFVPHEINTLFLNRNKSRGNLPIGVTETTRLKKFYACFNENGRTINLGQFDTPEEAFHAYKVAKEKYIKEITDIWKDKISSRVYKAMYKYKIEITD